MLILSVLFLPTHPSLHLYEVALHMFRIVVTKLFPVCNAGFDAVEQLQYDVLGRFICPELTVETPAQRRMRAASDAEPASGQHDAARMSLPSYRGGEPPGELRWLVHVIPQSNCFFIKLI